MSSNTLSGYEELLTEWRQKRDGRDCVWSIIVDVKEARGLRGLAGHGLNDCKVKVRGAQRSVGFCDAETCSRR